MSPHDSAEPVFEEPWQAEAFALVVHLHEKGAFSWAEWATALSDEIKCAPDAETHYYGHWLAALEQLVKARGLAAPAALERRKQEWAEAYRRTPHGKPVEL